MWILLGCYRSALGLASEDEADEREPGKEHEAEYCGLLVFLLGQLARLLHDGVEHLAHGGSFRR